MKFRVIASVLLVAVLSALAWVFSPPQNMPPPMVAPNGSNDSLFKNLTN